MALAGEILRALHLALRDLVFQAVAQLLIALEALLHLARELVHVLRVAAGEALHEIAHFLLVRFELFREAVELVAERFRFFGRQLEGFGRILFQELFLLVFGVAQKTRRKSSWKSIL